MTKIVRNFNGFKKIYENEVNSESEVSKIETNTEDAKKAEELIDISIEQSLQQSSIKNKIDRVIQAQSQKEYTTFRESLENEIQNNLSKAGSTFRLSEMNNIINSINKSIEEDLIKRLPSHPIHGKVISSKETGVYDKLLIYEDGFEENINTQASENETNYIKNLLKDAAQRQKTIKWLSSLSKVAGTAAIAVGVGLIIYGVMKRSDLYEQFRRELNNKFGFSEYGGTSMGREGDFSVPSNIPKNVIDEMEKNDLIRNVKLGTNSSYNDAYGYVYNWDKILSSDQVAQLSSATQTYILSGAITSGIGSLCLLAGFMMNNADENSRVKELSSNLKLILSKIGLKIEDLKTEGDVVEVLSRDYSSLTIG